MDPLGHHLADAAGACQAVRAEARRDEQPVDLGLAEAELVVGREGLGAVDQLGDGEFVHRRNASARVLGDLLEALPVLLQQLPVEVRRNAVDQRVVERPRRAVALVAAHHDPVALLAVVDEQVGVAQRRQVAVRGARLAHRVEWLRDEVLVRHRHDRHAHAGHPADLGGEHPAGVDEDLALDVAPLRRDAAHATARARRSPRHACASRSARRRGARRRPARRSAARDRGSRRSAGTTRRARRRSTSAGSAPAPPARTAARAAARTCAPTRPGAASPARARACRPGGCRRTRSSPGRTRTPRAGAGRARRCTSSSASARRCRAADRRAPRNGTSIPRSARRGRRAARRARRAAPGGRRCSSRRRRRR